MNTQAISKQFASGGSVPRTPIRHAAVDGIKKLPGVVDSYVSAKLEVVAATVSDKRFLESLLEDQIDGLPVHVTTKDQSRTPYRRFTVEEYEAALEKLPGVSGVSYHGRANRGPISQNLQVYTRYIGSATYIDAIVADRIKGVISDGVPHDVSVLVSWLGPRK